MEEKSRGLSLRKKRSVKPKISAPKQISAPIASALPQNANYSNPELRRPTPISNNSSSSNLSVPRQRGQQGGIPGGGGANTADYVKRRYSQRITNLPKDFGDAPTLPQVPSEFLSQPPARAATRAHSGVSAGGEKVAVDLKALQDPHLPADQYVARLLVNASEQDIRDYQADLSKIKNRTSTDLQYNVYQNRSQFIKISQEAERLKTEMRALRNLMSDLTSTLGQTNAALGITTTSDSAPSSSRRYAHRSSVANLEAMWSTHLHELWRRVEGSQKFLPAIPGRHVLHESSRWVELNTATFKPRRRVHLILLNDHLLIACEKKRVDPGSSSDAARLRPGGPTTQNQLVAERCLPLQDVDVADLAVTPAGKRASKTQNTVNAISVRAGADAFTYAAADAGAGPSAEKPAFLAKFRKALADLRKLLHVDADEHPSLAAPRQPQASASASTTPEVSATARASMLVEVDGRQQSFRWVENQVDELDIDIALQRFEDAVERVDTLRRVARSNRNNAFIQELVETKVSQRAGKLAHAIVRQLVETNSFADATRRHVARLIKLGFESRASEAFLEARSGVIRERVGACCADTGDLTRYVWQVGFIYFRLMANTVRIYQGCFGQGMGSRVVRWAKGHVDQFNEVLARQMSRLGSEGEKGGKTAAAAERRECLRIARAHTEMLNEVGIDFRNLVGRGVQVD